MERIDDEAVYVPDPDHERIRLALAALREHYAARLEDLAGGPLSERQSAALALDVYGLLIDSLDETGSVPETLDSLRGRLEAWQLERDAIAVSLGVNLAEQPGGHADVYSMREWAFGVLGCA